VGDFRDFAGVGGRREPQLEELLRAWVFGPRLEMAGALLFPSFASGQESPLRETRRLLDRIAQRIGWKAGEIRHRIFRHTYCAARLQTLDRSAPVSLYTVSRELGHGSEEMVRRVYSHLGSVRHRSEVVEYRVEQHFERLGDQLRRLGFVITSDIKDGAGEGKKIPATPKYRWGKIFQSGPGATRTRDLLLRSRPRPATASAHQRKSLGKHVCTASRR
jgi:hypothetical protein